MFVKKSVKGFLLETVLKKMRQVPNYSINKKSTFFALTL